MGACFESCFWRASRGKETKKKGLWRTFSLKELHAATNNFNYDNKLGEGAFGSVYWGQLWDGSQIAVKRLKAWSDKAEAEFATEIEILGKVRHKNLLSLRGFCIEGQERLIVYDYVSNLSLLSHLHGSYATESLLDWKRRMTIAIGSAEGIAYLHHHVSPHIIHRDIKASNVLLNAEFQAQVVDFGFAKFIPEGNPLATTGAKGNLGYLAPEYNALDEVSEACDVYSFGVLLLELVSGRRPVLRNAPADKAFIVDWALPLAQEGKFEEIADPKLDRNFNVTELRRVVLVALASSQNDPDKRPTMLEVVGLLKGQSREKMANLENLELFKPCSASSSEDIQLDTPVSDAVSSGRGGVKREDLEAETKHDPASTTEVAAIQERRSLDGV